MEKTDARTKNHEQFIAMLGINRFSERLAVAMEGLSNVALTSSCDISESAVRSYLKGKNYPGIDKIEAIAIACKAPMEWLITGEVVADKNDKIAKYNETRIWNLIDLLGEEQRKSLIWVVMEHGVSGIISTLNGMSAIDDFLHIPESDRERVLRLYKQIKERDSEGDQEPGPGDPLANHQQTG
ncbi:transcriptional regulator [Erwinia tracheiphila]|uniref:transcriptional regulator n=1 Tax=Erwinia tracheiphila TaxID=65700 RepID=UPI0003399362|nr:transcriptional regulator [Erwinia tracheiphila]EOS95510.1 putative repressor protein [Erwinia tracheiphila PSU-1]UIA88628.1 transcriptional regulator [Erwinia tracheiphila]UIA97008.1 transcriptional regulator [Erwinia tracheiphila]